MLTISNLHATVTEKPILKGLSLQINAGEVHAIMGPNGAGKSTTGYVLGGRPGYEVTGGSVEFDGANLLDLEPHDVGVVVAALDVVDRHRKTLAPRMLGRHGREQHGKQR